MKKAYPDLDHGLDYMGCIEVDRIINMITKMVYYGKPTYNTLLTCLTILNNLCKNDGIKKLAIPKRMVYCCDKLRLERVEEYVKDLFSELYVEILICDWSD